MSRPRLLTTLPELRDWRGARTGPVHFVPTMGNLHAGHLRLVDTARAGAGATIASIFVNPAQFGPGEDYERYPRTLDEDMDKLAGHGCDAVWAPDVATMYPRGADAFRIRVPDGLGDVLCGAHRAGHFDGVATVVARLFWQIRPDRAFFGEKDWQQWTILRAMVEDLSVAVAMESVPTEREADGLAMSSRNRYLDEDQRRLAPRLHETLAEIASRAAKEPEPGTFPALARSGMERLAERGFEPEYVEFRDADTLGAPTGRNDRIFAAARLGTARLIDNVAVKRQSAD
ncbi:MAG: pantoate--beta-alanine ligase [Wenzhouxiangellaceae bacterium]|nr:pantoate--beta-alanine ligase [Wenzhouxiangellaceae bacterium]